MRSATTNTKKRFPQKALAAAITTIILGTSTTAMAFKPDKENHGHTFITNSVLGGGYIYHNHPLSGRISAFTTKFSDGTEVKFSEEAIKAVRIGNQSTDYVQDADFYKDGWLGIIVMMSL